jgi:hypothetical protein
VTNSTNLDVFVERYFSNVGVLGGGFVYKSLSDPIFVQRFVQDYQGEPGDFAGQCACSELPVDLALPRQSAAFQHELR